ncbi:MAG: hypothetical protein GC168_16315 [Candidatus Hydrogenedens sp.]|nr:hypothetical protein [Candidatus Hydrogenedens sp.]
MSHPEPNDTLSPARTVLEIAALAVLLSVCLGLFISKPFHIDDPLFVWTARQVVDHPYDFYGFDVNWKHEPQPMWEVMQNPPLLSYYLAFVGERVGWSETIFHLAMLPFSVAALLGVYAVARLYCRNAWLAALLCCASPGFLVSCTSIMTDVPMFACYVWAIYFWMLGLRVNRPEPLVGSMLCAVGGFLFKYFALSLVPLLLVYTLLYDRTRWKQLGWMVLPILAVAAYEIYTASVYGRGLLFDAMLFASSFRESYSQGAFVKTTNGVVFIGACLAPIALAACALLPRKALAALGVLAIVLVALALLLPDWAFLVPRWQWKKVVSDMGLFTVMDFPATPGVLGHAQWALWLCAGLALLATLARSAKASFEPAYVLLALWAGGTILFGVFINHLVNARVLLPLAAPAAIYVVMAWEGRLARKEPLPWMPLAGVAAAGIVLSLLVAQADQAMAQAHKAAPERLTRMTNFTGRNVYFCGHFGFQYYMQELGAEIYHGSKTELHEKDLFILPLNTGWPLYPPEKYVRVLGRIEERAGSRSATQHYYAYAGFYADTTGPLPFAFGIPAPEEYVMLEATADMPPLLSIDNPEADFDPSSDLDAHEDEETETAPAE